MHFIIKIQEEQREGYCAMAHTPNKQIVRANYSMVVIPVMMTRVLSKFSSIQSLNNKQSCFLSSLLYFSPSDCCSLQHQFSEKACLLFYQLLLSCLFFSLLSLLASTIPSFGFPVVLTIFVPSSGRFSAFRYPPYRTISSHSTLHLFWLRKRSHHGSWRITQSEEAVK